MKTKSQKKTNPKKKVEKEYTFVEFKKVFLGEKNSDETISDPKDFGKKLADSAIKKIKEKILVAV